MGNIKFSTGGCNNGGQCVTPMLQLLVRPPAGLSPPLQLACCLRFARFAWLLTACSQPLCVCASQYSCTCEGAREPVLQCQDTPDPACCDEAMNGTYWVRARPRWSRSSAVRRDSNTSMLMPPRAGSAGLGPEGHPDGQVLRGLRRERYLTDLGALVRRRQQPLQELLAAPDPAPGASTATEPSS